MEESVMGPAVALNFEQLSYAWSAIPSEPQAPENSDGFPDLSRRFLREGRVP
jgi:hypothetical protein